MAGIAKQESVSVVHNALSASFTKDCGDRPQLSMQLKRHGHIAVGFLGRDYPHKNLGILVDLKSYLKRRYELKVDFFVTLTPQEWNDRSTEFRVAIKNVGALAVVDCPKFYSGLDGVIFPSMLECFSITPLEAMAMRKPLFA